ncbi:MAG: FUSC family protein, partial [Nitrosomonadaceae bacterium]|nr:FUSC family protein [Nitrosomonadaceae bacterium]
IWIIFLLFPAHEAPETINDISNTPTGPTKIQRFNTAITSTLVILPVLLLFYFFNLTSSLLILIFISILSMQPAFAKDFKKGKALILGNSIGGFAAIIAYEVFTVVPEFYYFVIVVLLIGLIFGKQVFSNKPRAALWAMGYSTFLLVICSTTASGTTEADAKVWTRVLQIMTAVIYIVAAFGLIASFKKEKKLETA